MNKYSDVLAFVAALQHDLMDSCNSVDIEGNVAILHFDKLDINIDMDGFECTVNFFTDCNEDWDALALADIGRFVESVQGALYYCESEPVLYGIDEDDHYDCCPDCPDCEEVDGTSTYMNVPFVAIGNGEEVPDWLNNILKKL